MTYNEFSGTLNPYHFTSLRNIADYGDVTYVFTFPTALADFR